MAESEENNSFRRRLLPRIYTDRLRKYIGDLPLDNGYFMTSATIVGQSIGGTDKYRLPERNNFYEFLPLTSVTYEKPRFLTKLNEGEVYELIITNQAGLYRYRTGCLIRAEERNGDSLIFFLAGRRGQSVKTGGATLSKDEIYQATVKTADECGVDVADFAFYADETGLTILLEPTDLAELSKVLRRYREQAE